MNDELWEFIVKIFRPAFEVLGWLAETVYWHITGRTPSRRK
jgi:hypothetical protein